MQTDRGGLVSPQLGVSEVGVQKALLDWAKKRSHGSPAGTLLTSRAVALLSDTQKHV